MNDAATMTYILLTESGEFYCGKTRNLEKRLSDHKIMDNKSWFNKPERCMFTEIIIIGDFEKQIKRAGVGVIFNIIKNLKAAAS